MSITLICPNLTCGRTIVVPDASRGKVVRCAHCNQPFQVPQRSTAPPTVAATDGQGGAASK